MADYSSVTLTVSAVDAVRTKTILEAADLGVDSWAADDDAEHVFEFEQARWGGLELEDVCRVMRDSQIAYVLHDSGHWTWQAYREAWKPGMDGPASQLCDTQFGEPVLSAYQFRSAVAKVGTGTVLIDWLDSYYSDDPSGWPMPEDSLIEADIVDDGDDPTPREHVNS